jgi:hypothetical protein
LTLVSILHVLESLKKLLIPQRAGGLLEHHQRHHALIHEQPNIVQITHQIEPALAAVNEQCLVKPLRLTLAPLAVLATNGLSMVSASADHAANNLQSEPMSGSSGCVLRTCSNAFNLALVQQPDVVRKVRTLPPERRARFGSDTAGLVAEIHSMRIEPVSQ